MAMNVSVDILCHSMKLSAAWDWSYVFYYLLFYYFR